MYQGLGKGMSGGCGYLEKEAALRMERISEPGQQQALMRLWSEIESAIDEATEWPGSTSS